MIRAAFACLAATVVVAGWWTPPAWAIGPPVVDAAAQPPSGDPGPVAPMEQRGACSVSGVIPGTDPGVPTPSQTMLNLPAAWQFSRGEGQLVAIIDTGVQPGPRLPNVDAGGDFVESTDGLTDCDGHGTLVAGIVAGQPGNDGFSGVAPAGAAAVHQGDVYEVLTAHIGGDPQLAQATLDVAVLAGAIVHAADLGAKVINVSTITCLPADRMVDQAALGAAIRYAAVDKDAVIVAAAGNTGASGSVSASCDSNPLTDLSRPDDPRNWAGVTSVSIPSWWQPYVLSVASLTSAGQPSKFSMPGPWVGIAAPGENIASVSNSGDGALANGLPDAHQKLVALSGTSYAAGYVSGVAALVRSRYPGLNATEVVRRLTATAHRGARESSNIVGAGNLDAVAALTWQLPAEPGAVPHRPSRSPIRRSRRPKTPHRATSHSPEQPR